MDFEKVIKERTSIRKFKIDKISNEIIEKILIAGNLAPTARNIQPQIIFIVQSHEGLEKIDKASPCRFNAPLVMLVCSDKNIAFEKNGHSTYEMDACIVATHMMLCATNLGIGSIWIEQFNREIIKNEFELGDNVEPICLIPMGYKADDHIISPSHFIRKPLYKNVKFV